MRDWGKGARASGDFPKLEEKTYWLGTNEGASKPSKEYWCLVLSNGNREDDWALVKIWGKIGVAHPQFQVFTGTFYQIQSELGAESRKRQKRGYERAAAPAFTRMIREVRERAFGSSVDELVDLVAATPAFKPVAAPTPTTMPAGWGEW